MYINIYIYCVESKKFTKLETNENKQEDILPLWTPANRMKQPNKNNKHPVVQLEALQHFSDRNKGIYQWKS